MMKGNFFKKTKKKKIEIDLQNDFIYNRVWSTQYNFDI